MIKALLIRLLIVLTLAAAQPAAALEGLKPGMKAPPLSLEALDGSRVSLGGAPGGRATLVVFWATWSAASPEVLDRAERLFARHRAQGLTVIGVNVESPRPGPDELVRVKALADRLGLSFKVALDRGLDVFHAYGVVAVPSSVLIGADGTVLGTLAAYPIAFREEFFDLVEATVLGRSIARRAEPSGPEPNPRAVRYFNLGRTMLARGQGDQADVNLKKAIELDGTFALPRILLGQLYRERAVVHEAIRFQGEARQTLRRSDEERTMWLKEAEQQLREAVRLDPDSAPALVELARVHTARGETTRGKELADRALKADPAYPPARSQVGALLMAAGDTARGRAELAAAIQLNPLDWRLHITAAQAYEQTGLLREAVAAYKRGVELLWQARGDALPNGR
jgi:Tfp pilus assembly protein PilF/peroxiredoxin